MPSPKPGPILEITVSGTCLIPSLIKTSFAASRP